MSLPVHVVGPVDVGRLYREISDIDDALHQLKLREGGEKTKMPKTSRLLDDLAELNQLNLLHDADRTKLREYLAEVQKNAPVLHMSFSADPSPAFLEKLVSWLRREIDGSVLVTIGLQPNLGAGCILRSTNKYFDLSLKEDFAKKRDLLKAALVAKSHDEVTA